MLYFNRNPSFHFLSLHFLPGDRLLHTYILHCLWDFSEERTSLPVYGSFLYTIVLSATFKFLSGRTISSGALHAVITRLGKINKKNLFSFLSPMLYLSFPLLFSSRILDIAIILKYSIPKTLFGFSSLPADFPLIKNSFPYPRFPDLHNISLL